MTRRAPDTPLATEGIVKLLFTKVFTTLSCISVKERYDSKWATCLVQTRMLERVGGAAWGLDGTPTLYRRATLWPKLRRHSRRPRFPFYEFTLLRAILHTGAHLWLAQLMFTGCPVLNKSGLAKT